MKRMGSGQVLKALLLHELSRNLCIFCQQARPIVVDYREIGAFSAKKPDQLSAIVSIYPLFSYISPGRPSFLTSLLISAPFRTLKSTFVSCHNWRRLESSILCMSGVFTSQESVYCLLLSAYCLLFYGLRRPVVYVRGLARQPVSTGLEHQFNTNIIIVK